MNAKAEQKERSHETILDSAARLVRERGIAGARVAEVMKGAGLTVGGFYAHFGSKEELVDEALRRTGNELRDRLFSRLEEKPEADRAEVVLKRYLSAAHRDEQTMGCPLPAVVGEIGTTAPEHRAALAEQVV
jgi:TetR/AcrR family transcriptional repressor of nem operon